MRAEAIRVAPVGVERIQDKTRWTKALGEAVTFVYGDCTGELRRSRCSSTADHENTGQLLTPRLVGTVWRSAIESGARRGEVIEQVEPMRGLWHRAMQTHGLLFVDWSSRAVLGSVGEKP